MATRQMVRRMNEIERGRELLKKSRQGGYRYLDSGDRIKKGDQVKKNDKYVLVPRTLWGSCRAKGQTVRRSRD